MTEGRPADFTIFAHVFYPDTWEEMVSDLDAVIRQPFDLVITRPTGSSAVARPQSAYLRFVTEIEVENRGRDILPFLTALKHPTVKSFDIGLKIHTKRSPHRRDGNGWRQFLVGSLLDTEDDGCLSGQKLLACEPAIGLIAPRAHLLPLGGRTALNEKTMMQILQRIENLHASEKGGVVSRECDFPDLVEGRRFSAGAMFWFRRTAMKTVTDIDFTDLFVRESGQLDGTAAHAFERMFAVTVEREGMIAAAMENVRAILDHRDASLSRRELTQLVNDSLAHDNPFVLPLADFWRRHPTLLKLAHGIYTNLPQSSVRLLRRSLGRGW
ncbi:hypothetical protein J5N58_18460 [Rhizobium cremeum]|uniref:rhamnan synthesis F family protein n=1 Tax=Rhizobium cremeum TaxID=2813827 RepID=UPI000DDF10BF|nr:rhamnan synthesis F family protein [Rhizobium cremeum]MCJ7996406.1 hypothetical protein [Rhizobium cremeum]MCJ8001665.1 hypothetical protein [Rhizobium cremeum]